MTAFLPLSDPNPRQRELEIDAARGKYQFNYTHVSPLAILDRVPIEDEFSFEWLSQTSVSVLRCLANRADIELHPVHRDYHCAKLNLLTDLISEGVEAVREIKSLVCDVLKFEGRFGARAERPTELADFSNLFRSIGLPPIARDYHEDAVFAEMRVAGPNPVMLELMERLDNRFPVTNDDFQVAAPGDSLERALAEERLFLADFHLLDGAELGDYPHGQKYVYAPLALFVVDRSTKKLKPAAIQCKQTPGQDNPIFLPNDGYGWLMAKTIVEIADGNIHEAHTHLGRTHLLMEPFIVAAFRNLAPNHPLAQLLWPHFEGTLAINSEAWKHLIAVKGAVDKLFGCSINAARGLAAKGVQTANVNELLLPKSFRDRRVDSVDRLPNYPYRDDAMPYWNAINEWASAYVRLVYESDGDVLADYELQNWLREVASPDGGRVSGLPHDGNVSSINELIDVLTLVLFTCSVQHAAVNFPQCDVMSFVPNMPLASYVPAPTKKSGISAADYLAMLPPLDMAELQLELGHILGTLHYTRLGDYREGQFSDARLSEPLIRFQKRIAQIGADIAERNQRRRPYEYLVPAGVPQSINI